MTQQARAAREARMVAEQTVEGPRIDLAAAADVRPSLAPASSPKAAFAAGAAAMADTAHVQKSVEHNDTWIAYLTSEIGKLGLKVTPSVGNFVLIHFDDEGPRTAAAADTFLKTRGVIMRRVAGYGLPNALRMTIGTEDDNRTVVTALADFMKGGAR